uniref:Uncharacterized protein n=1 Tax=Anguilla anguilla TaxID=7936 RepID=A0A0E9SMY5_ANGAN
MNTLRERIPDWIKMCLFTRCSRRELD